jgi:hypothetical protein
MSPHEALFGFPATYPFEVVLQNMLPALSDRWTDEMQARATHLKTKMQTIWMAANSNLLEAQREQATHYNEKRRTVNYEIGSLVLLNVSKTNLKRSMRKMKFDWHGPYRVTEKTSDLTYKIEPAKDGVNTDIAKVAIHVSRLKAYATLPDRFQEIDMDVVYAYDEDLVDGQDGE